MYGEAYGELLKLLDAGETAAMVTRLHGDGLKSGDAVSKVLADGRAIPGESVLTAAELAAVGDALERGVLHVPGQEGGNRFMVEPCLPEPRLVILGGGHVAKPLAEFGARLGFRVTVVDDRISFANTDRFPDAEQVLCESFDRCFEKLDINRSCYVVIVTRGHRHDMDCYRQVLEYDTAYVGMIGSKRRIQGLRAQFVEEGVPAEKLAQLHAPIGLDIGGVTPEEIALSILAEVVKCRRLGDNAGRRNVGSPELDRSVLEELAKGSGDPKALVTIIGTKGSVPRKAGAKMLVWPYGRTLGSIGGGCSESEVITLARDVIRDGGWCVHRVDMTGQVAESEGMVCGGVMDVLIEACL